MNVIKIAITGPECSGKSELTRDLAHHFGTSWAREYARQYLEKSDGVYTEGELIDICKGQIESEDMAIQKANKLVFFDTDMLVLKIWSMFRFGTVAHAIDQANALRPYHLRLLCAPDLPWQADPFRESPEQSERDLLFALFENQLIAQNAPYAIISGRGEARLECAIEALDRHFALA